MTTKVSSQLTLRDRLSRLTFLQACKLLGERGKKLIQDGGKYEIDIEEQVYLGGDLFRLSMPSSDGARGPIVTITLMADARHRLHWSCDTCSTPCVHAGAAFSLILEEKMALGLAAPPPERIPVESLGEDELVQRAIEERAERARTEKMKLQSTEPAAPWTDYTVTSTESGKTYRLALRGERRGVSYCSCPDFRTNTLGTCKHIMHALAKVKRRFTSAELGKPYRRKKFSVHLDYGAETSLRLAPPHRLGEEASAAIAPLKDGAVKDVHKLIKCVARLAKLGQQVVIYPDAEQYIQQWLFQERIGSLVSEIRRDPAGHRLRTELLKTELLPYQLDGIAFAVGVGRAILADDMGLGKTIQGVGVAELLAREAEVGKVLVICPTSLKSQWASEVERFSGRTCQLVMGSAVSRSDQYDNESFFTICNYEQVLRDLLWIERVKWDLIILDEGQRIKNWEAKTSNVIKSLRSPFALVLSGTPLENRLDELYSVVQFVDDRRLAPAYRFFNRHRMVDEKGKVLGYKKLAELRQNLQPILLRRTRGEVLTQLPPRTTELVRIPPTEEQRDLHIANMRVVASIVRKRFISEMDMLRLRQALLVCRMSANSTYLVDKKQPGYSSKLARLEELLVSLFAEENRKVILFSEWTTMLDLVERVLEKLSLNFVRLDGSVPQKQRQQLVHTFQNEPTCQLFITTNAGSTGLNLQSANTVVNVDLPWNPAVLEQRIGRAHRMGQRNPVQVFVLVTEETIEETLLATLSAKQDLALAALDVESDVDAVEFPSGMQELKNRLEILLGAKPEAAVDQTLKQQRESETQRFSHRERVAAAGGELLGAAFTFLGELIADKPSPPPADRLVEDLRVKLSECAEEDEHGRQRLSVTLPDRAALDNLASALAKLLSAGDGAGHAH